MLQCTVTRPRQSTYLLFYLKTDTELAFFIHMEENTLTSISKPVPYDLVYFHPIPSSVLFAQLQ
jgi:hypothetical protein